MTVVSVSVRAFCVFVLLLPGKRYSSASAGAVEAEIIAPGGSFLIVCWWWSGGGDGTPM